MTNDEELVTIIVGEERTVEQAVRPQWPTDEVCAAAVDRAREALLEEVDASQVGDPTGLVAEGPLVVTHYFDGHVPGYTGWQWAVTVTRAPDSDEVTIDETALLPDEHALLAPAWVPWKNRIQSGDIGVGDVLVTEPGDMRLVPGLVTNDVVEPDEEQTVLPRQWELGLGRERMLSPEGRREAAHRWYREVGPRSQIARAVDLHCSSCGFLLLIGGPMGQAFGVCANGFSPVDGHVVAMDFGCGAHSETVQQPLVPVADIVVDEVGYEQVNLADVTDEQTPEQEPELPDEQDPGAVDVADDQPREADEPVADSDPEAGDLSAEEQDVATDDSVAEKPVGGEETLAAGDEPHAGEAQMPAEEEPVSADDGETGDDPAPHGAAGTDHETMQETQSEEGS